MVGRLADPWIQAQLDAAVAPYKGRIPDDELEWMRDQLASALAMETRGVELMRRAAPRHVEKSGEVGADSKAQVRANKPLRRRSGNR
ncbi:MAG: hypothetical protein U0441_09705 [Polyangiaceae bacterium]